MYEVKGMSCGACVSAIERLLLSHQGVEQASVALLTERANVRIFLFFLLKLCRLFMIAVKFRGKLYYLL